MSAKHKTLWGIDLVGDAPGQLHDRIILRLEQPLAIYQSTAFELTADGIPIGITFITIEESVKP